MEEQEWLEEQIDRCSQAILQLQELVMNREGSEVHRLMGKIEGVDLIRSDLRDRLGVLHGRG